MTVAVFIPSESDATSLIQWGVEFACADQAKLLIVCPKKSKGKKSWQRLTRELASGNSAYQSVFKILDRQDPDKVIVGADICEASESTDDSRVVIETQELVSPNPEQTFAHELGKFNVKLLLIPDSEVSKSRKVDNAGWAHNLLQNAPCEVAVIRGKPLELGGTKKILIACQGQTSVDDELAVRRGSQLAAEVDGGELTLVYVRPDDDDVAVDIAEKHLKQLARLVPKKVEVIPKFQLADSFREGILQVDPGQFDLVLIGSLKPKTIRMVMRDLIQEKSGHLSVATIRDSVPLTDKVWAGLRHWLSNHVPQLDRESRVSLVERLQSSSKFDFDFVALISLSTLIAALGLARDSGAVVIGAMLVAPLMTPLVGMGFALVQGNEKLIRSALKSVVWGFTVALGIGVLVGLFLNVVAPHFQITTEMKDRNLPNLLDLVVALASGVAGAYAMGRPNLVSAIPGVAIAAALVPPIATSGLALSLGHLGHACGASLLFLTNIVAIVLGTAITFWVVGIKTRKVVDKNRPVEMWPYYWFLTFVIASFIMAAAMSVLNPVDPLPIKDASQPTEQKFESGD
ncbi:MAG: DUF389 domain-containing protein [Planctomycetota bacterium]